MAPKSRMFNFILQIFPFLVFFTYSMLFLEAYTYIGALKKYIFIDSRILLYLTITLGLYIAVRASNKEFKNNFIETIFSVNSLITPVVIFLYYYFLMAEAIHYPNFIFSTYHIQPANIVNIVYLNLSLLGGLLIFKNKNVQYAIQKYIINGTRSLLINKKDINELSSQKSTYFELILITITLLLLSNYLLVNITSTFAKISTDLVFIVNNPKLNYDQKMEKAWGRMYYYFQYVNNSVPINSIIATPPAQHRWLRTGNTVVMRYFLYPHKLINLKETWKLETLMDLPSGDFDYILLIPGDWNDSSVAEGWPKKYILAEYVEYFDPKTLTSEKIIGDFDPINERNQKSWGIIKVRH